MTSRLSAEDLIGQTPTYWVMDLTPPAEWDELDWPDPLGDIKHFLQVMGQQYGKAFQHIWTPFIAAGSAAHAAAQQVATASGLEIAQVANIFEQMHPALNAAVEVQSFLQEFDEERHGTYTYKPFKNNLGVPAKKTNTGPPINPHARHGRGGKR